MTFFEELLGFTETTGDEIRRQLRLDECRLTSRVNGSSFEVGTLTTPSLTELRARKLPSDGRLRVHEVVDDVQNLHADPANAGAFFQVASQFNLLEMVDPSRTPADGVGIYERDLTQGPACAIACAAGTIYRNWLVPIGGQHGQDNKVQIDCLADMGDALGQGLWHMQNGYALATSDGLHQIHRRISTMENAERDRLMGHLRIGIQSGTEVTIQDAGHTVTQGYCSALPVAYSEHLAHHWESFARFILDASYEATMYAAWANANTTGNRTVFLTCVGGGAFGNPLEWIIDAMKRAFKIVSNVDLDVRIVSYGSPEPALSRLFR